MQTIEDSNLLNIANQLHYLSFLTEKFRPLQAASGVIVSPRGQATLCDLRLMATLLFRYAESGRPLPMLHHLQYPEDLLTIICGEINTMKLREDAADASYQLAANDLYSYCQAHQSRWLENMSVERLEKTKLSFHLYERRQYFVPISHSATVESHLEKIVFTATGVELHFVAVHRADMFIELSLMDANTWLHFCTVDWSCAAPVKNLDNIIRDVSTETKYPDCMEIGLKGYTCAAPVYHLDDNGYDVLTETEYLDCVEDGLSGYVCED